MNTIHAVYRILKILEKTKGDDKIIALNKIREKIGDDAFCNLMTTLSEDGYVAGVDVWITGEVDIEESRITMKGIEYLNENSSMKKAAAVIGTVVGGAVGRI